LVWVALSRTSAIAHHRPGHGGGGGGSGGGDTWSFDAESIGHVDGDFESKEYSVTSDVHNLVFNKNGGNFYQFSDYFRDFVYDGGRSGWDCFVDYEGSPRPIEPPDPNPNFAGSMQLYDEFGSGDDLVARFWFWAGNAPEDPADKLHVIDYVLSLYNFSGMWFPSFPPDVGVWSNRYATHWELAVTKGRLNRKEPCVTSDLVAFPPDEEIELRVIQNP
ncbi:MAG: hypothetical protein R3212_07335, partial [Xanthomonadales bacterium]|nr:hypothetical protein [Xanthomonadales bacterium]